MRVIRHLLIGIMVVATAGSLVAQEKERVRDLRKGVIENPIKKLIAATRDEAAAVQDEKPADPLAADAANPDAIPGLVRWHTDFDMACRAAQTSGKPVLLFQLLGRLDQRFT